MSQFFFSVWSKFPVLLKTFRRACYLYTYNQLCKYSQSCFHSFHVLSFHNSYIPTQIVSITSTNINLLFILLSHLILRLLPTKKIPKNNILLIILVAFFKLWVLSLIHHSSWFEGIILKWYKKYFILIKILFKVIELVLKWLILMIMNYP